MTGRAAVWLLLALAGGAARAGGTDDGAALHAAHCTRCHGDEVYTRGNRLVHNAAELRDRVRDCELLAEAGWFEEEVEAVVEYLDERYYRFRR
jgi:mono/diheme cytochrome c family protein